MHQLHGRIPIQIIYRAMRSELGNFRVTSKSDFSTPQKYAIFRLSSIIFVTRYTTIGKVYIFWMEISWGIHKWHYFEGRTRGKRNMAGKVWIILGEKNEISLEHFAFVSHPTWKRTSYLSFIDLELSENVYFYYATCYKKTFAQAYFWHVPKFWFCLQIYKRIDHTWKYIRLKNIFAQITFMSHNWLLQKNDLSNLAQFEHGLIGLLGTFL